MGTNNQSVLETVVELTRQTGIVPCIKLAQKGDWLAYAQAMYDGGARIIEITMTTPGALEGIQAISTAFPGKLWVAAGTVLDAATARQVIEHGGSLLVSPAVVPEALEVARQSKIPMYCGAFTATECLAAMRAGATMIKIFPAQLGGPKYMTNLRMVYPSVNLIPSGGISLENAADYIRCGACAVSGARTFMNMEKIQSEGLGWITRQVAKYVEIIREAKQNLPPLP